MGKNKLITVQERPLLQWLVSVRVQVQRKESSRTAQARHDPTRTAAR